MTPQDILLIIAGFIIGGIIARLSAIYNLQKDMMVVMEQRHRDVMAELSSIKTALGNVVFLSTQMHRTMQATLQASENFVDALRESAHQMDMQRPDGNKDDFRDLRKKFEDGIDGLREDDTDDDEEEGPEWKK